MMLTDEQNDVLTEVINIGVGRAASSLSELLSERIELSVPNVIVSSLQALEAQPAAMSEEPLETSIIQDFSGLVSGRAILAFPRTSGLKLSQILCDIDETPDSLDVDLGGVLNEVGNILLNGVMGSISNFLGGSLDFHVNRLVVETPVLKLVQQTRTETCAEDAVMIANAHFRVDRRDISGWLLIVFQLGSWASLIESVDRVREECKA